MYVVSLRAVVASDQPNVRLRELEAFDQPNVRLRAVEATMLKQGTTWYLLFRLSLLGKCMHILHAETTLASLDLHSYKPWLLQKATDVNQQSTSAYHKHGHSFMDEGGLQES